MSVRPAIIPVLRYADAPAAIHFLCEAFGFEHHAVYPDHEDESRIAHAELSRAGEIIMLSTSMPTPFSKATGMQTPVASGVITQSIYVVVEDVDRHAAIAQAAGAQIFLEPEDQSHGGRSYSVFDCEGNAWTFGSYDPASA